MCNPNKKPVGNDGRGIEMKSIVGIFERKKMKKQDRNRLSKKDRRLIKKALLKMAKQGLHEEIEITSYTLQAEFLKLNRSGG